MIFFTAPSIELPQEMTQSINSLVEKVGDYIVSGRGSEFLKEFHKPEEKAKWALDLTRDNPEERKDDYPTSKESQQLYNAYVSLRKESGIDWRESVQEMNDILIAAIIDRHFTEIPTPQIALLNDKEQAQAIAAIDALKKSAERGNTAFGVVLPQVRAALKLCLRFKRDPSLLDQPGNAQEAIAAKNLLINAINTANRKNSIN